MTNETELIIKELKKTGKYKEVIESYGSERSLRMELDRIKQK